MAGKLEADVDELVHRARIDAREKEHRYVYNDSLATARPGYAIRPNKKAVGRKVSTFYIIVLLFASGFAIVGYINNIIVVNKLSAEINRLQIQYDKISNTNAVLGADINRKSSWDRIVKIAGDRVGLRTATEQPTLFDVDEDLVEQAAAISREK
jgi:cell division protein FtsB